MSSIPNDIYLQILLRVPVKSTFVCKCVCKTWNSLISDPDFAKMHLDFTPFRNISGNLILRDNHNEEIYSIDHDSLETSLPEKNQLTKMCYPYESLGYRVTIEGSWNGVVCLQFQYFGVPDVGSSNFFFCLWNPATREYKKITKPTNSIHYGSITMSAFGYDHKNDDYKLVIGVKGSYGTGNAIHVYSMESNKWKSDVTVPYCFFHLREPKVLVNGKFHFLAHRTGRVEDGLIVSADVSEEIFKKMDLSTELEVNAHRFTTVAELQGCLCVLLLSVDDHYDCSIQLWVMQDYGVQESWTKRYTITHPLMVGTLARFNVALKFIWSSKNDKILFTLVREVILYNLKDGTATIRDLDFYTQADYFESLVSVKSGTYMGEGQIEEPIELEPAA